MKTVSARVTNAMEAFFNPNQLPMWKYSNSSNIVGRSKSAEYLFLESLRIDEASPS